MLTKKIVITKGSPRREGSSAILAKQVAEGARSAGARVGDSCLHHAAKGTLTPALSRWEREPEPRALTAHASRIARAPPA